MQIVSTKERAVAAAIAVVTCAVLVTAMVVSFLATRASADEDASDAKKIGFVFVDAKVAELGSTQSVAVALNNESDVLQEAVLVYKLPSGQSAETQATGVAGNAASFEIPANEIGTYALISMHGTLANGTTFSGSLRQDETADYCGFEVREPSDEESADLVDRTVSVPADKGIASAPENIPDALIEARVASGSAEQDASDILTVVLDPGHGGSDPGASGLYGLEEKNLTLKIAQYCKAELESYSGVRVLMTRDDDSYVGVTERADLAKSWGGDVFVSIHINAYEESPSAHGSEVYYPYLDSDYNHDAAVEGYNVASSVLEKLEELGLRNRGLKTRLSENNTRYSDGSLADYYGLIRRPRELNMPGIIVEHAFITNPDDAQKLSSEEWLKKLGVADAQGIAKAYGLSQGHWEYESGVWHWYENGMMVRNAWRSLDGGTLWFGSDGVAARGWTDIAGKKYYFDEQTAFLATGWLDLDGSRYRLDRDDGHLWTGWFTVDGTWYFARPDGSLYEGAGWFSAPDGRSYYVSPGSAGFATGWLDLGGRSYRLDRDDGHLWTGWFTVDGAWFHADGDGALTQGWLSAPDGRSYYCAGHELQKGWLDLDGSRYRLDRDDGHLWTGWFTVDGAWYQSDENGVLLSKTEIMGHSNTGVERYVDVFNSTRNIYPSAALRNGGAENIDEFCRIVVEEAETEGVKSSVLFSQIMVETGWLQFGGDVSAQQFNFGGLGATGGGASGATFENVRTGIRAQAQHLKAYASHDALNNPCVDPRFDYVERGCAPYVEWLGAQENPSGQGWALSSGYGYLIANIIMTNALD